MTSTLLEQRIQNLQDTKAAAEASGARAEFIARLQRRLDRLEIRLARITA